jgi:hypothetical protein
MPEQACGDDPQQAGEQLHGPGIPIPNLMKAGLSAK